MRSAQQQQPQPPVEKVLPEPSSVGGGERRERAKSANTVASRMKGVVEKLIQERRTHQPHPSLTVFVYRNQQLELANAFFQELQKENGTLFANRDAFLALIMQRYDEFHHQHHNDSNNKAEPPPSEEEEED